MEATVDAIKELKYLTVCRFNKQLTDLQLGKPYKQDKLIQDVINYISLLESGCIQQKHLTNYYLNKLK